MARSAGLACTIAASLLLHAPASADQPSDPFGYVQFIHAATNVGPVDVRADGRLLVSDVAYGGASAFNPLPHGARSLTLFTHGESDHISRLEVDITAGDHYVLVSLGTGRDVELGLRQNVRIEASTYRAEFFAIHAAFDTGPIDIRLRDPSSGNAVTDLVYNNLVYASTGVYRGVEPAGYIFDVTSADNTHTIGHFFFQLGGFARQTLVFVASGRGQSPQEGFSLVAYDKSGEAIVPDLVTRRARPETLAATSLDAVYPNPSSGEFRITYTVDEATPARLDIVDVLGRHIATLRTGPQSAGTNHVRWDGRTASGEAAASGIYFCRLTTATRGLRKTMMLAR